MLQVAVWPECTFITPSGRPSYEAAFAGPWHEASVMTIANSNDLLSANTGYLIDIHLEYSCLFN